MRARLLAAALVAALLGLPAATGIAQPPRLEARAWALVDARTGELLAARAGARRLPIASTTKMMTAYVARRELPLRKRLRALPYESLPGESLLDLRPGERVSVRDLLYGLIMRSGNDAARNLALAAAGSEAAFVGEMNRYAAALGLADTHFANSIGLDEVGNYSSAYDLASLGSRFLRDPVLARIADARTAVLNSLRPARRIVTRNDLLYRMPRATGIKTGHTPAAGHALVGSARRGGVALVAALLGAPSEAARDAGVEALLDYGFSIQPPARPRRAAPAPPAHASQEATASRFEEVRERVGERLDWIALALFAILVAAGSMWRRRRRVRRRRAR